MDSTLFSVSLAAHVTGGMAALLSGPVALLSKRGSRQQDNGIWVHFIAMALTCTSGFLMAILHDIPMLMAIAIFSFYSTWVGFKTWLTPGSKPGLIDWLPVAVGLPTVAYMFWTGNTILMVFGGFFLLGLVQDFLWLRKGSARTAADAASYFVSRFGGSYIATLTAFLVVNFSQVGPQWIWWIGPSIVGSPLLGLLSKKAIKEAEASPALAD